jgi:hypothetical protein
MARNQVWFTERPKTARSQGRLGIDVTRGQQNLRDPYWQKLYWKKVNKGRFITNATREQQNIPVGCPVDSSAIASLNYDRDRSTLLVRFNSGSLYAYSGVSRQRYQAFCAASSKGRYLNAQIKGNYPYRRIG